jgi:hypothetical protein
MIIHNDLVIAYGRLEQEIQSDMTAQSRGACARCNLPCCRIDFCRESLESAFLIRVREHFAPEVRWDPVVGWLTPAGCGLTAGRPPVCYEFLCRVLEACQPTERHFQALRMLARVITDAGKGAGGKLHLVELDELDRLNRRRLTTQLSRAREVLDRLKHFWAGGEL